MRVGVSLLCFNLWAKLSWKKNTAAVHKSIAMIICNHIYILGIYKKYIYDKNDYKPLPLAATVSFQVFHLNN